MPKTYKNRNNDMYLSDWYDKYLMKYVNLLVYNPKYQNKKRKQFNETLMNWYENWNGWMEEQE